MLKEFKNRASMLETIEEEFDSSDFQMVKRNVAYGHCVGFYNDENDLVGVCSISMYGAELHIYTFEISDEYKHQGYGREFYNELVEKIKPWVITLDPLDDNAEAFWKKLGFNPGEDGDGNPCFVNFLHEE